MSETENGFGFTLYRFWWLAIYAACLLWALPISLWILDVPGGYVQLAIIYGWFIAWIVMPVAIWDDTKFVRATSDWTPRKWLYVIPSLVPLVAIVPGVIYLVQRHRHVGVP